MNRERHAAALRYVDEYWEKIIRHQPDDKETLIGLPKPYVVPAPHPFDEMYYWDTAFTLPGLIGTRHEHLIADAADNFTYLVDRFGMIPNASRFYYTSRSQPPFFTQVIRMAYDSKVRAGDADAIDCLRRWTTAAEHEHRSVWLGDRNPHHRLVHRGLSRYHDINYSHFLASCEGGWDHSTRCGGAIAGRESGLWMDYVPVCLNCILHVRETDLAWANQTLGNVEAAAAWTEAAARRLQTMHELMYDADQKFFFDFNYVTGTADPHPSLAGFYPLWAGLVEPEQAAAVVGEWLPRFLKPGGLVTTLASHPDRQWASPNGWAPLHALVVSGLERYGFHGQAADIKTRWCETCLQGFERFGTMLEKYNVEQPGQEPTAGLYGNVPGFGWTNAVYKGFVETLD